MCVRLCCAQTVGFFHAYVDGVDYVFVDHPCFNTRGADLYGGTREDLMFRCSLLSKAALEAVSLHCRACPRFTARTLTASQPVLHCLLSRQLHSNTPMLARAERVLLGTGTYPRYAA